MTLWAESIMSLGTDSQTASKYLVVRLDGAWRIRSGPSEVGAFASRSAATEAACAMACGRARSGTVGVVVVQDDVQELHCFSPGTAPLRWTNDIPLGRTCRAI